MGIRDKVWRFRQRAAESRAVKGLRSAKSTIVRISDDMETKRLENQSVKTEKFRNQAKNLRAERSHLREKRLLRAEKGRDVGDGWRGSWSPPNFSGMPGTRGSFVVDMSGPGTPGTIPKPKRKRSRKKKR